MLDRLRDAAGGSSRSPIWGADLDRIRADLDELEAFGFAIERHPYQGVAYRGPADRLCPDQIEDGLGDAADRPADRGLEPGDEHQRPGRAGGGIDGQRRAGRPRRGTDGGPRQAGPDLDRPAPLVDPDVGPALPAARARTAGPSAGAAWLTALGAVATAEVVAELDRARRADQVAQRRPGRRPQDRRGPRRTRTRPLATLAPTSIEDPALRGSSSASA